MVPARAGANEFRVGVFVVLGLAAFMTVLFLMTNPATFRGRYKVVTQVDRCIGDSQGRPRADAWGQHWPSAPIRRWRPTGVDITLRDRG